MNKIFQKSGQSLSPTPFFFIFILIYSAVQIFYGERIPIGDGFGWDGQIYGALAKNFYQGVFVERLPFYYVQRVVPSAVIHYALRLFHIPLDNPSVIRGFLIYNSALLLLIVCLWGRIADELKLSRRMEWLFFVGLFCNFFILKQAFYYPVLTDTTAFFSSVLMLYLFLKKRSDGLLLVTLIGTFAWPACAYFGILLYLFSGVQQNNPSREGLTKNRFNIIVSVIITGLYLSLIFILYQQGDLHPRDTYSDFDKPLFPLTICGIILYLFFGNKEIFLGYSHPLNFIKTIKVKRFIVSLGMFFLIHLVVSRLGYFVSQSHPFQAIIYGSIIKPFLAFIAITGYFGPVAMIAVFVWKPLCAIIRSYGTGLVLLVSLGFTMSVDSEARHSIFFFPFLVAFAVKAADTLDLSKTFVWFASALSLIFSKVWWRINAEPFRGSLLEFPFQNYFMSHGPWISKPMYLLQGGIILVTGLVFYFLYFRKANAADSSKR